MKILVTGGCGFIGRFLIKKLLENPDNFVIVMDNFSAGQDNKFIAKEWRDYTNFSLFNMDAKTAELPDVDVVFHLAAHIGTKSIIDEPFDVMNDNISMIQNIIKTYQNTKTKVIYTSTSEVCMGVEQERPTLETAKVGWNCPLERRWGYSFSKYVAEELLKNSQCNWSISRFGNVYGPQMVQSYAIKAIMNRILDGENPLQVNSPLDTRTFCYVDDIVEALILMMVSDSSLRQVFHLAYPKAITILELHDLIVEVSGKKVPRVIMPQKGKPEHRLLDISNAKELLDWTPKVSLREGLLKTWNYYQNGKDNR